MEDVVKTPNDPDANGCEEAPLNQVMQGTDSSGSKATVVTQRDDEDAPSLTERFIPPACSFPWLLTVSVVQFGIYLNKLYQDSNAVSTYYTEGNLRFSIVAAVALIFPAISYALYLAGAAVVRHDRFSFKEVGSSFVQGLFLVPWQIKGHVEVLQFSTQRICFGRRLQDEEKIEVATLRRLAFVLEFFEDFYAGFLHLLLQLYIIISIVIAKTDTSLFLIGELIGSVLSLLSLIHAFQRSDDGILTGFLSKVSWVSLMAARCVAIALASSKIHGWIALLCLAHVSAMSVWIASIAWKTHEVGSPTPVLSTKKKAWLFVLVFLLFGLPSLTYWPIMFEFKKLSRVLVFLGVTFAENMLFFCIFYFLGEKPTWATHNVILTAVLHGGTVIGVLFLLLYLWVKPPKTDEVVRYHMKVENANSFGIYFDFCDVVLNLPIDTNIGEKLKKLQHSTNS